ncbi:MAG: RHS repeat-associated core domain-containing protein [Verrucomicrobiota bacterium]
MNFNQIKRMESASQETKGYILPKLLTIALLMLLNPGNGLADSIGQPIDPKFGGTPSGSSCNPTVNVQFRGAQRSRSLIGFDPFIFPTNEPIKYLIKTITENASGYITNTSIPLNSGTLGAFSPWSITACDGKFIFEASGISMSNSTDFVNYGGVRLAAMFMHYDYPDNPQRYETNAIGFYYITPRIGFSAAVTSTNNTCSIEFYPRMSNAVQTSTIDIDSGYTNLTGSQFLPNPGALDMDVFANTSTTPTVNSYASKAIFTPASHEEVLSDAYTIARLYSKTQNDLNQAMLGGWGGSGGGASYSLDSSLENNTATLTLQKLEYQFYFNSAKCTTYTINWDTLLIANGVTTTNGSNSEQLDGTDGTVYSAIHTLNPPSSAGTLVVANVRLTSAPDPKCNGGFGGSAGGGGGGGSGGGPGGCSTCRVGGQSGNAGGSSFNSASPNVSFGLGGLSATGERGILSMSPSATPSPALYSPSNLVFAGSSDQVAITTDANGQLQQINAALCQVKVIPGDGQYQIQFFARTNTTYQANAFVTYTVRNPNYGTDDNTLQIIETRNDHTITNEYHYLGTNTWQLSAGNGLQLERLTRTESGSTLAFFYQRLDPNTQQPVWTGQSTFTNGPWGWVVVTQAIDPSGLNLVTAQTYDANGYLETVTRPDGSWNWYQYNPDGTVAAEFSGFKTQGLTTNATLCRVTRYDYTPIADSGDDGSEAPHSPRTVTEYLTDQPVRQTQYVYTPGQEQVTQVGDSGNLTTTRIYVTDGLFVNEILREESADGTRQVYFYSLTNGNRIVTQLSGAPDNADTNNITAGTITITTNGPAGQLLGEVVTDKESNKTIALRIMTYDLIGRLIYTTYLDGTSTSQGYQDCCNLAWLVNREGIGTTNTVDDLKRVVATMNRGVITGYYYTPAGQVRSVFRSVGAVSAMMSSNRLDAAGRIIESWDRQTNLTQSSYSQLSYYHLNRTQYPNGGWRVEKSYPDGQWYTVTGTVYGVHYDYGVDENGEYTQETKLNTNGTTLTSEWTKTWRNALGQSWKTLVSGQTQPTIRTFDAWGQLSTEVAPDGVTTIYTYNSVGDNESRTINGRGTKTVTDYTTKSDGGNWTVRRTRTYQVSNNGEQCVATNEVALNGLRAWSLTTQGSSSQTMTLDDIGGKVVVSVNPLGNTTTATYSQGRLVSVVQTDTQSNPLAQSTFAYDEFNRQFASTNVSNGRTTVIQLTRNNADQVTQRIVTGNGLSQTNSYEFDSMGQVWRTTLPDGQYVTNLHDLNGQVVVNKGARTYPASYSYDYAGRMKTLSTWTNFANLAGEAVTTWNYNDSGLVQNKRYANDQGPAYTFTDAGRVASRTWQRNIQTTYTYTYTDPDLNTYPGTDLTSIAYDDNQTPGLTLQYNDQGRLSVVYQGGSVNELGYNDAGQITAESRDGLMQTNAYNLAGQLTAMGVSNLTGTAVQYSYDTAGRLSTVTASNLNVTYSYQSLLNQPDKIEYRNNTTLVLTVHRSFDGLQRLQWVSNVTSSTISRYAYGYDPANQRTNVLLADGSNWRYSYDVLGQVTNAFRRWSDGSLVAGQQYGYLFDDIGNRRWSFQGHPSIASSNTVNNLNQVTSRTVPNKVWVLSEATNANRVVVNSQVATKQGSYFAAAVPSDSASGPLWLTITNVAAVDQATNELYHSVTGHVFVPQTPESLMHDLDGNLTNDGRSSYSWDAENRLLSVTSLGDAPTDSWRAVSHSYDYRSRRIGKISYRWDLDSSQWTQSVSLQFVYNGWNLIAERDDQGNLLKSHVWGNDVSGTMQGAGGVGGLVATIFHTGPYVGTYLADYDGSWNIRRYIRASDGVVVAEYEYDPFHNIIRATGPMAREFNFLAATKYYDWETRLYYYGYRYFKDGRWISRDPIEEEGGINLYGFIGNNPVTHIDWLGLDFWQSPTSFANRSDCKLAITYDFESSWAIATHVKSIKDIQNDLDNRFKNKKYDPSGECCKGACIGSLTLTAHGIGAGKIPLSGGDVEDYYDVDFDSSVSPVKKPSKQNQIAVQNAKALFAMIKAKMCKNGTIYFAMCASGTPALQSALENIFGPDIKVVTFPGNVCPALPGIPAFEPWISF